MKLITNKINRIRQLPIGVKASVAYAVASMLQSGLAFITTPIFTRLLTQNEYGEVAVYYSISQLVGTIALFSLGAGCMDIGLQDNKNDRSSFIFSTLILSNIITLLTGGLLFLLWPFIKNYIGVESGLMVVMFVTFIFSPALTFWTRLERFEYRYKLSSTVNFVSALLSALCAIYAIRIFTENKIYARIIGSCVPMLVFYLVLYVRIGYKANFRINKQYWKFCFIFNLPLLPHYLSAYILSGSDRVMIANLQGTEQTAYYSFAYNFVAIASIIWMSINNSLVPYILERYEHKEYKQVSNTVMPILCFFCVALVLIMLFAPELTMLLGTENYYQAVYVIPPVIASAFFQALYMLFTNVLYYLKKPKYVMYASISSGCVNVLLNYLLIPVFGYIVAAYTTIFSYALQAYLDYAISKKIVGENIYDMKKIVLLSIGIVSSSIMICFLYASIVTRYGFIIAIFMLFVFKRRMIFSYLSALKTK
jgi:O-antigen/teichoic acid export membrane protein